MAISDKPRRWLDNQPQSLKRQEAKSARGRDMDLWVKVLGPLLDTEEARRVLKLKNTQEVLALSEKGLILTLDSPEGRNLYPALQFSPAGELYPEIARVIAIFTGIVATPYTIASWLVSPQDLLDGEIPAAWMRAGKDTSQLLAAARRAAGELSLH